MATLNGVAQLRHFNCQSPRLITTCGRQPMAPHSSLARRRGKVVWIDRTTRCRKCGPCLEARKWLWSRRAEIELAAASRTWFGTITLKPEARYEALAAAGVDSSSPQRFETIHRWASAELTKAFKRLRQSGAPSFRYLLVAERHQSGDPHYHMLLHENGPPVRKLQLEACWPHGFTSWRLVDANQTKTARYVAKYLAKDSLARVRASVLYGTAKRPNAQIEDVKK